MTDNLNTDTQQARPFVLNADAPVIIHHLSGKTLIAKVVQVDDEGFHVLKACELMARPSGGPNGVAIGFIPFLTMGGILPPRDNHVIIEHHIVDIDPDVPEAIAKGYLEFTSGIAIPPRGLASSLIRS